MSVLPLQVCNEFLLSGYQQAIATHRHACVKALMHTLIPGNHAGRHTDRVGQTDTQTVRRAADSREDRTRGQADTGMTNNRKKDRHARSRQTYLHLQAD